MRSRIEVGTMRSQLRRFRRRLTTLDSRQRDRAAQGWAWLADSADQAKLLDRSSARRWFQDNGLPRAAARTFAEMAKRRRAQGDETSVKIAQLFGKMARTAFSLRRPPEKP